VSETTTKKPPGGLGASRNPQARMQQLLQRPPGEETVTATAPEQPLTTEATTQPLTHSPTQAGTQILNEVSTDLSKPVSNGLSNEVSTPVSKPVNTPLSEEVLAPVSGGVSEELPPSFYRQTPPSQYAPEPARQSIKAKLLPQAEKEPLTRMSVDVPESLHARIKRFCADNRIPSTRHLMVTLVEDFLEQEGY
jgi:hypothetical protein